MTLMQKMENKFGKLRMPSFMLILIILQVAGTLLNVIFPQSLYFIAFLPELIFKGQVWRVISFLAFPMSTNGSITDLLYVLIIAFIYITIARNLEMLIGRFRVNFFLVSGILLLIATGFAYYLFMTLVPGLDEYAIYSFYLEPSFLYAMLFVLYAIHFPDAQFRLFFLIPIKGKFLVLVTLVLYVVEVAFAFVRHGIGYGWILVSMIVAAIVNVLLFILFSGMFSRGSRNAAKTEKQRVKNFRKEVKNIRPKDASAPRHRCVICGRTELSNPELEFRYCTKCVGNYEYCSDHLYSHLHKLPNITDGTGER